MILFPLNKNRSYLSLFFLLGIVFFLPLSRATENNQNPSILWDVCLEGENICYSPGIAMLDKEKNTILLAGTSYQPDTFLKGKFWIWEIDQEGKLLKKTLIEKAPKEEKVDYGDLSIKGLILSDNNIFIILNLYGDIISFVKMTRDGKSLVNKKIFDGKVGVVIRKTINTSDSNLVLLGNDGLMLKLDADGNKLWQKKYALGQVEFFTDGVATTEKGGFMATGCSADYKGIMDFGPSDVFLLKCDSDGIILSEEIFAGRRPQICKLDTGNLILVYDKGLKKSIDYKIRSLDSNLKTLWEKDLIKSNEGYEPFMITSIPKGGFIIAGCLKFNFYFFEFDQKGNKLNEFSFDPGNYAPCHINLLYSNDKVFVILNSTSENNSSIDIVKILAVKLKQTNKR